MKTNDEGQQAENSRNEQTNTHVSQQNPTLSITRFGVSSILQAEFAMLREQVGVNERLKFTRKSVDLLAQILVCRNYSKACYELAHLCWAILQDQHAKNASSPANRAIRSPLLDYFWISQIADKYAFVDFFDRYIEHSKAAKAPKPQTEERTSTLSKAYLRLSKEQLLLHINGHDFCLHASRANFMSCFMEWLIAAVPNLLDQAEQKLSLAGHTAISEFASDLQKAIYRYLSEHLPPAKLQRRYRHLDNWYTQNDAKSNHLGPCDESVLQFWSENYLIEGFGKFSNVLSEHLNYIDAKDSVLTEFEIQYANNIDLSAPSSSIEQQQSGLDESALGLAQGNTIDSSDNLLAAFLSPNTIDLDCLLERPKALKQSHKDLVEIIALHPRTSLKLSLSWLRSQVFGRSQNQLIQAKRKQQSLSVQDVQKTIPSKAYAQVLESCVQVMANNQQVVLAIAGILAKQNLQEAMQILSRLSPQLPSMRDHSKEFATLIVQQPNLSQSIIAEWQLQHPWLNTLMKQVSDAQKRINRHGLTQETRLSDDQYMHALEHLFALNASINKLALDISNKKYQHDEKFASDRLIFISELGRMYCQEGD